MSHFWLPTKPYSLADAINRRSAATGSYRGAMASADANYNGHSVHMHRKDYQCGSKLPEGSDYWTAHYTWSGPKYVSKGTFATVLAASVAFHARQGRGASLTVFAETAEQDRACLDAGLVPWSREIETAHYRSFADARFDLINDAIRSCTTAELVQSASADEYSLARESRGAQFVTWLTSPAGERVIFVVHTDSVRVLKRRAYGTDLPYWQCSSMGPTASQRKTYRELLDQGYE